MIWFAGKTAMMLSYMVDKMPQDYKPTVSDTFTVDIKIGEELVTLNIHDTAGQDEFERWEEFFILFIYKVLLSQDAERNL